MSTGRKTWVKVSRAANGTVTVSVSLQEENLSVRWAVKAYTNAIKAGVIEATAGADRALKELQEAVA